VIVDFNHHAATKAAKLCHFMAKVQCQAGRHARVIAKPSSKMPLKRFRFGHSPLVGAAWRRIADGRVSPYDLEMGRLMFRHKDERAGEPSSPQRQQLTARAYRTGGVPIREGMAAAN
jgi:hypothetical protein